MEPKEEQIYQQSYNLGNKSGLYFCLLCLLVAVNGLQSFVVAEHPFFRLYCLAELLLISSAFKFKEMLFTVLADAWVFVFFKKSFLFTVKRIE